MAAALGAEKLNKESLVNRYRSAIGRLQSMKAEAVAVGHRAMLGGAGVGGGALAGLLEGQALKSGWDFLTPKEGKFAPVSIGGGVAMFAGVLGGKWLGNGLADALTGLGSGVLAYKAGNHLYRQFSTPAP